MAIKDTLRRFGEGFRDWATVERAPDMEGMRRKIKTGTGIVLLKNTFGWIIKWTVGVVIFLLVLFMVIGALVFMVRIFSTGTSDVMVTKMGVALNNIPAGQAIKGAFSSIFGVIWNPEQVFSDPSMKTEVDQNTNKKLGVAFTKFSTDPKRFMEKEMFISYGMVEITPFKDTPINLNFTCVVGEDMCEKSTPNLLKGITGTDTRSYTVSCRCNAGNAKRNIDGKVVTMRAGYNFVTKGYMPLYTIGSAKFEGIRNKGGNPFEGLSDSNLDETNGVVTSTYTNGPLKLAIGSYYSQPFNELGPDPEDEKSYYILNIELSRKITATGIPTGMKKLQIIVPDYVEIDTSEKLFTFKNKNKEGFKVYEMAKQSLDTINNPCKKMLLAFDKLTDPDCRKIWEKGFLPVRAKFRIDGLEGGANADLGQSYIIIDTEYNYEESIPSDIVVVQTPTGGVQAPATQNGTAK